MGNGAELPSEQTVNGGAATPLARADGAKKQALEGQWRPGMGFREYSAVRKSSFTRWLMLKTFPRIVNQLPCSMRIKCYRMMGVKFVGGGQFISRECLIDSFSPELITIEADVWISPRVIIECHNERSDLLKPVTLGAGSCILAGAIIGPGVTVGAGAVVGAGSVALQDVPPGAVVIGVPARVVGNKTSPRQHEG
jgi:acetyltransferase-like isoleucine patch superfamily enzyme